MGIGTLGFLSGASKTALSGLQAREEEERQKRRDQLLAKLQQENAIALKKIDIEDDDAKVDDKLSTVDYETGLVTLRNAKGKDVGTRKVTQAELDDNKFTQENRKLSLDKTRVGIENDQDQIRSRRLDDARSDRVAGAQIGSYNRSNRGDGSGSLDGSKGRDSSSQDVAALIRNDYSDIIKEFGAQEMESGLITRDGKTINAPTNRPAEYITGLSEQAAAIAIREARDGKKDSSWMYNRARDIFRKAIQDKATTRSKYAK